MSSPPTLPSYPVYELLISAGCLCLSLAAAAAVHDITKIFIRAASKRRQADDDKHVCDWVSFL